MSNSTDSAQTNTTPVSGAFIIRKRKFKTAYDAYWWIFEHPAFTLPFRSMVAEQDVEKRIASGEKIVTKINPSTGEKVYYRESTGAYEKRNALEEQLDIFYAKVNKHKRIGKNQKKNKFVEVWLEFGPMQYYADYEERCKADAEARGATYQTEKKVLEDSDYTYNVVSSHDPKLDCGAKTFDQALIKLAKKIQKFYGDYPEAEDI